MSTEATPAFTNSTGGGDDFTGIGYTVVVPSIWGLIVVIGAVGNTIVVFTMCKQSGRSMPRTATNCYITNVALADLAFLLIVIPFTTANFVTPEWLFGETMCKLNNYVVSVSLLATCLTLTAMTIDRYFAIVHPIRSLRTRTHKIAFLVCLAIWVVSLIVCIPYLQYHELRQQPLNGENMTMCLPNWPHGWFKTVTITMVMVTYVIPLSVIIISYSLILKNLWSHRFGMPVRNGETSTDGGEACIGGGDTLARRRRKVAKMVAVVVILFAITWLPIHVFTLFLVLHEGFQRTKFLFNVKIVAHTLSYCNSCVNPFVYTIMGDGFRKAFKDSLPKCCPDGLSSSKKFEMRQMQQRTWTNNSSCQGKRSTITTETRFNGDLHD